MKVACRITGAVALVALGSIVAAERADAVLCAMTDVLFKIDGTVYNPISCADRVQQGGGPTAETSSLNTQLATTGFVYLDKSDDPGTPIGIGGVTFEVTATGGNTGT